MSCKPVKRVLRRFARIKARRGVKRPSKVSHEIGNKLSQDQFFPKGTEQDKSEGS